jgi:hypothetical protein
MRLVVYLLIILMFGSCATIFNSKNKNITIYTDRPVHIAVDNDTISGLREELAFVVKRKKDPLIITLYTDTFSKKIRVNSRNSFAYWLNAYPGYTFLYGFLIDRNKPKRYSYPTRIYIDTKDTSRIYRTYDNSPKKGRYYLHLSMPYINQFYSQPSKEPTLAHGGFFGLSGGLDYYYHNNRYVSVLVNSVTDEPLPFPAPLDRFGDYTIESAWCSFVSVSNNHELGKFRVGYGLSYSENFWSRYHSSMDSLVPSSFVRRSTKSIGLIFSAYHKIGRWFNLGIIYKPSLYNFSDQRGFVYEHLVSLDLAWKVHLSWNSLENKRKKWGCDKK